MKVRGIIRLTILAGQATSKEPVGPTLGQLGIPLMDFCNKFNNLTQKYISEAALKVLVFYYGNQKYDFIVKYPARLFFIQRCFKIEDVETYTIDPDKDKQKEKELKKELELKVNYPGYFVFPINKFYYVTPYILYEVFMYHSQDNPILYFLESEYKKFIHSLKSNGLVIIRN